jgi:hypothetical protein
MDNRPNAFASSFPFPWLWPQTPTSFEQPILPGWSFGNVVVNQQNSSAPATELDIVARQSYGRQIGKLVDAVAALIAERGPKQQPKALAELVALRERVEQIKTDSAKHHLEQLRRDLARLKDADPAAYATEVAALRPLLAP